MLALSAWALVLPGPVWAGVTVWFTQGKEATSVTRAGATIDAALKALLRGPTAREQSRGLRSAIPRRTPLLGVTVKRRIVTVDLGARFVGGRSEVSRRDRVGQLIRTLRSVPGVRAVLVRVEGGIPVGFFPGYDLRRPVAMPLRTTQRPTGTRALQRALADLGFLAPSGVSGSLDDETATAVLGFQKWAGLPRDGVLGATTAAAILRATRPEPVYRAPGRRIEVHLGRQLALLIQDDRVLRSVHISSGAGGATPAGSFRVFRKERYSWSVPFKVWLPWASYIVGGIAFHEYGSVPTYPASHGCIRVNRYDAAMLYGFAESGTPVRVLYEVA